MQLQRWKNLLSRLEIRQNDDIWLALIAAYSEQHRSYHTAAHIQDCLNLLDWAAPQIASPDIIEIALWFHDAVYDPHAHDNEEQSAGWAESFLADHGASFALSRQVHALIMATRHTVLPKKQDAIWMVDIDLSILGSEAEAYDGFEAAIRHEYNWVAEDIFRRKRASILRAFLERPRLYTTDTFHERFEKPARSNLERALNTLA